VKPRVPEAGRSKTELRRGQIVERRSAEAATTEEEQDFLFAVNGEQEIEGTGPSSSPPEGESTVEG
jgi:hypothetical protein